MPRKTNQPGFLIGALGALLLISADELRRMVTDAGAIAQDGALRVHRHIAEDDRHQGWVARLAAPWTRFGLEPGWVFVLGWLAVARRYFDTTGITWRWRIRSLGWLLFCIFLSL